jgi:hypothetical protein
MINGQGRTELKWKTENYYTVGTVPYSDRNIVEKDTTKTHIDLSLYWLDADTSIKRNFAITKGYIKKKNYLVG